MRSFTPSLVLVALSLPFASAHAQTTEIQAKPVNGAASAQTDGMKMADHAPYTTNEGWNAPWALNLAIPNFIGSTSGWLTTTGAGSIAGSYIFSPDTLARLGLTFSHFHNPELVTKKVVETGGSTVTTYNFTAPTSYSQYYNLSLHADYLKRLMSTAVAPYVGVGAEGGWNLQHLNYTDKFSTVGQRTEVNNDISSWYLLARGILGAEWRIHSNFALYAEYALSVTIIQHNRSRQRTTTENTTGGATSTTETRNEYDQSVWLNTSTGLAQGATLGLEIFF